MGDIEDSHYERLLYGNTTKEEDDHESERFSNDYDVTDDELDLDLQESTLSHVHYVPMDYITSSKHSRSTRTSKSNTDSNPSTNISSTRHSTTTKKSVENDNEDESRYTEIGKKRTSTEVITLVSSDSECSSYSVDSSNSSILSPCSQPSEESGEILEEASNELNSESLPHHTIDTEVTTTLLKNKKSEESIIDYTKWDTKFFKSRSRYWLSSEDDHTDYPSKHPRRSYSPKHEQNVIIPCLKCSRDHDKKYNCKILRCQACMKLNDHITFNCPFFRLEKCGFCHLRFHEMGNCSLKNSSNEFCKNCPKLPIHLPEHCPRLWRVYVANNNPEKKPRDISKSCSYCGHPHFFDGCTNILKSKKFQSPWNKLSLRDRQATVLQLDHPEAYTIPDFVMKILLEPHPYLHLTSPATPHARSSNFTPPTPHQVPLKRTSSFSHSIPAKPSPLPMTRHSQPHHPYHSRSTKYTNAHSFPPHETNNHSSGYSKSTSTSRSTSDPKSSSHHSFQDLFPDRTSSSSRHASTYSKHAPVSQSPWHHHSSTHAHHQGTYFSKPPHQFKYPSVHHTSSSSASSSREYMSTSNFRGGGGGGYYTRR
ncbi:hypothetical protein HMI54_002721 [Coelomomyces lativittatus]|nr:hypothetical protein HMI56_001695 [Coelomomyces lativittatus]KAJ1505874.1 hypothetical protein HMI55_001413 [Coelomomyces lativittatus]KAJ1518076.1 hypothetical protein HMI54_002721 [Coelomomyces lativittatus]